MIKDELWELFGRVAYRDSDDVKPEVLAAVRKLAGKTTGKKGEAAREVLKAYGEGSGTSKAIRDAILRVKNEPTPSEDDLKAAGTAANTVSNSRYRYSRDKAEMALAIHHIRTLPAGQTETTKAWSGQLDERSTQVGCQRCSEYAGQGQGFVSLATGDRVIGCRMTRPGRNRMRRESVLSTRKRTYCITSLPKRRTSGGHAVSTRDRARRGKQTHLEVGSNSDRAPAHPIPRQLVQVDISEPHSPSTSIGYARRLADLPLSRSVSLNVGSVRPPTTAGGPHPSSGDARLPAVIQLCECEHEHEPPDAAAAEAAAATPEAFRATRSAGKGRRGRATPAAEQQSHPPVTAESDSR